MGTGSVKVGLKAHLIYWMRVEEILTFDAYWSDPRFRSKRPIMRGSAMQRHGDNIYYRIDGKWHWVDSFHSAADGAISESNLSRDVGRTDRVLIGHDYAYWGAKAPQIPHDLATFVLKGQGRKCRFTDQEIMRMESWLQTMPERGFLAEPADWRLIAL